MSTIQISKTIETQFLNEKKETYLQLSADFAIMRYSPKSKPALQQFISLLVLDIALLLGCDITWKKNPDPWGSSWGTPEIWVEMRRFLYILYIAELAG